MLDGEPLMDTRVLNWYQGAKVPLPDLTASSGYSSSLISKLPVGELLAKFESVRVWITPNIEDHIHRVSLHRSLSKYDITCLIRSSSSPFPLMCKIGQNPSALCNSLTLLNKL